MIREISFIALIVLVVISLSCSEHKELCPNQLALITPSDSLPLIEMDCDISAKSKYGCVDLEKELSNYYGPDICEKNLPFKLSIPGITNDYIGVSYKRCSPGFYVGPDNFEILINYRNVIMVEGEIISGTDKVLPAFVSYYRSLDYGRNNRINLMWDRQTSLDSLSILLEQLHFGYLNICDSLSRNHFQKSICQLVDLEIDSLKTQMPFSFEFDFPIYIPIVPLPNNRFELTDSIIDLDFNFENID